VLSMTANSQRWTILKGEVVVTDAHPGGPGPGRRRHPLCLNTTSALISAALTLLRCRW